MPAVLLDQQPAPNTEVSKVEKEPSDHTHRTAFMVLVDEDNNYTLEADINKPVVPKRKPNSQEIKAALSVLLMDMQTQETAMLSANATVSLQMQMAQRMSEAQQYGPLAQQIAQGKR
jgi:hypothetical protein